MSKSIGPLSGVTVVDLTRVLAGPTCTQMLGDLGADVIKIERLGAGDDTRKFAPPFVKDGDGKDTSESSYFMGANRNKRSVAIDIAKPEGAKLVQRMVEDADVLVENFKTGNLAKYSLGYDDLKDLNPKLIYCSVTGFGQTGPYALRPGYDFLIQGMGGLMSITGTPDGEPEKVGVPIADIMAGMYASVAINAGLRHAAITGKGQYIDIGMLDTTVAMLANAGMNYIHAGMLGRLGNAHPNIVPYQPFKTADGFIIVAIGNDSQFQRFCELAKCTELCEDINFATNDARVRNRSALLPKLNEIFESRTSGQWLTDLEEKKIGCGPINNLQQVFDDPHVKARGMVVNLDHPLAGEGGAAVIGSPMRFTETPITYRHPPPLVGQHTREVLREKLGLTDDDLSILEGKEVI
ncbi:MAG: Acetyl-CoA:oxalate CoA-transferase [Alphaproteobacteria bacterium MarineAlpha11_Bin1]|nr:MAG: Acetyl-CoA:oxalate CoA-transferase [Alphaproteobacteria bacterium MarineAlpha11_Bin1]|tara:strand:+ start:10329 stop:11552 length:1224 start_codon:yes stop_codon:yes gene_type:complete